MGRSVLLSVMIGGALLFATLPLASSMRRWKGLALLAIWLAVVVALWSYISFHLVH